MLDAYVIEEIKRRERDKSRDDRPSLELPVPVVPTRGPEERSPGDRDDRNDDRGVVIIDYN
jgi:hypothetical protein